MKKIKSVILILHSTKKVVEHTRDCRAFSMLFKERHQQQNWSIPHKVHQWKIDQWQWRELCYWHKSWLMIRPVDSRARGIHPRGYVGKVYQNLYFPIATKKNLIVLIFTIVYQFYQYYSIFYNTDKQYVNTCTQFKSVCTILSPDSSMWSVTARIYRYHLWVSTVIEYKLHTDFDMSLQIYWSVTLKYF